MRIGFLLFSILFSSLTFASLFEEPYTGMRVEIPEGFFPCEDSSYTTSCPYWYTFSDASESILSIEIEEYEHESTLHEHFHKTITETDLLEEERIAIEELEFTNFFLDDLEITKLKVRFLAITDEGNDPLYFCDYLFVRDQYGITIGLFKKETDSNSNEEIEAMMTSMFKSIRFEKQETDNENTLFAPTHKPLP